MLQLTQDLFNRNALGKVAGLINVAAALERDVVREELERHDAERGQQHRGRVGNGEDVIDGLCHFAAVALRGECQHIRAAGLNLNDVAHRLIKERTVGAQRDDERAVLDERDGAVLQLAGGVGLGVDIADLLELQAPLQRQGVVQIAAEIKIAAAVCRCGTHEAGPPSFVRCPVYPPRRGEC